MKQAKWFVARFSNFSRRNLLYYNRQVNDRFEDEFDPQTPGRDPSTPVGPARISNFYFAQLEEIERFDLTTLYVDFENLLDFTVNGEKGILAQAIATQYYR